MRFSLHSRASNVDAMSASNLISRWSAAFRSRALWSGAFGVCAIIVVNCPAHADPLADSRTDPRAVIELFTSQGCSSCPPADKILGELSNDPTIIAMSWPIDYWDYLGWKDTLADSRFSARQRAYSRARGDREVYTPQVVVNGSAHVIGSDRARIESAIDETARSDRVMRVPVTLSLTDHQIKVSVAAGKTPAVLHGEVWICSIARSVPIAISRGENRGLEITYHNVVRHLLKVGDWNGGSESWTVPLENVAREGVDGVVVYVQDGGRDQPGPMLGARYTSLH